MNLVLAGALAVGLLAAAPSPATLVAGSVRDQNGAPIGDATVLVYDGSRPVGTGRTAADGTFVFDGTATTVRIRCAYCRTTTASVGSDGIVTAIVERFEAVRNDGPSAEDIGSLPGADLSSLLQRVPFVVVNDTSRTIPGLSATDRNATPYGGLLVLDDVPDYDVTAGITPFDTVPQGGAARLSVLRVDDAYRYGNIAQGGTFIVNTPGGFSHAGAGDNALLRAALYGGTLSAAASFSNAQVGDRAQRAAVSDQFATPGTVGIVSLSSGAGYDSRNAASALFSSFSSAYGEVHSRGRIDAFASASVDHATYDYTSPRFPAQSMWSDSDLQAGVDSHATVAPFVHFDVRDSSGSYLSSVTGPSSVSGWLLQARTTAGVMYSSTPIDALVAGGVDSVGYNDIIYPTARYADSVNDGVASFTYRPFPGWSLHASASRGYTLQTFLSIYDASEAGLGYGTPVIVGHTNEATLEFGDDARVRGAVTALEWAGQTGAATSSAGASVAWQIAPQLVLRTWVLQETTTMYEPATVGSAWLTWTNANNFRADVMFGRSLLDRAPYNHVDATVSGRLTNRIDWFASSSRIENAQQTAVGLRIR